MARHTRRSHQHVNDEDTGSEIYDKNGIKHTTPRSLKKINYAEIENSYDYMEDYDEGDKEEEPAELENNGRSKGLLGRERGREEEDEDEDEEGPVRGRRGRKRAYVDVEEDESFHEEEDEEDEEALDYEEDEDEEERNWQRRREHQFVVDDEDDEDEDEEDEYGAQKKRGRRRTRRGRPRLTERRSPPRKLRTRRTRSSVNMYDSEREGAGEALTLEDEIRELQEDSPIREKRSLRERTKPVNYTLPPPLTDNQMNVDGSAAPAYGSFHSPRGKRGLHSGQSFGPIRRLFPTGGPFGGNDVTAIFGQNTNFYAAVQDPTVANNKFIDSDSSDDEILPLGTTPKPKSSEGKKKKKPEIADLDPLGVDMNINFDDIGGLDNYIDQLKEMVALPLLYPELYQNFNITPPRGVLFYGPPGTGKTLMARALAASCSTEKRKITFYMRKGADILSKWVGEAERQLRLLFEEAKKHQPSIIFFDEIDGLAPVRSSKQEQIHASIVSTMLALMDGMDNRGQVIVIGATNRPDAVDPALRRPGRFDREFYFPLPDIRARAKILEIHTRKWHPPLSSAFIEKLASLTKGYGGADLRALCTEAALNSIQRRFPQIYQSDVKLAIDPGDVHVKAKDFMVAMERITPSSARSSGNLAEPLPRTVAVLLNDQFEEIKHKLNSILPEASSKSHRGSSLIKEYLEYEDDEDEEDNIEGTGIPSSNGFSKHEFFKMLDQARTVKPKLLITGPAGNGQQYIGSALLHHLEDYNIQNLDLGTLLSESLRTMESAIVQTFIEAKKRQPSVIYIPNADIWSRTVPESAIMTLASLFRSLKTNERVLLLAIAEGFTEEDLHNTPLSSFGFDLNIVSIREPSTAQRHNYFKTLIELLKMKPTKFREKRKRKKPLPVLPVCDTPSNDDIGSDGELLTEDEKLRRKLKSYHHQDMKLKNTLKIKLSGLMDLFKGRYKRFRKPPIEDALLIHLFEPEAYASNPEWQPAYVREDDMILEVSTGRKYYNMDLDIIEERLWNGYYSEPKQYLKDIELIYRDANTTGDRERIIKASEMFANAQMGIEEISTPELIQECRDTRQRELLRQQLYLRDQQKKIQEEEAKLELEKEDDTAPNDDKDTGRASLNVGAGQQLHQQSQLTDMVSQREAEVGLGVPYGLENNTYATGANTPETVDNGSPNRLEDLCAEEKAAPDESSVPAQLVQQDNTSEMGSTATKAPDVPAFTHGNPAIQDSVADPKQNPTYEVKSPEAMPDAESELTPREDSPVVPEPAFILDETVLAEIISTLKMKTQGFTVEQLETCYAAVLELVWEARLSWDKTSVIKQIEKYIGM
ncbi:AaceriABR139Wp [[Ashbya] aceris (nom. inval.)]|nr:AaceriABR139Wp [[Ashbya] aceris (nom. inval.)]